MRFAEKALLLVLYEVAVGLAALNVFVWNGFLVDDGIEPAVSARVARPQPVEETGPVTVAANRSRPAPAAKRRPSADRLTFELGAVGGDSWTSIRRVPQRARSYTRTCLQAGTRSASPPHGSGCGSAPRPTSSCW
jgi:hypothetical protein